MAENYMMKGTNILIRVLIIIIQSIKSFNNDIVEEEILSMNCWLHLPH